MAAHHINDDSEFMQAQEELGTQNRQSVEATHHHHQQQQQQQQPHAAPAQQSHAAAQNILFALAPGQAFANSLLDY